MNREQSSLLKRIMEDARKRAVENGRESVSAEFVIISSYDIYKTGELAAVGLEDSEERKAVCRILEKFRVNEEFCNLLLKETVQEKPSYVEIIVFQKLMYAADMQSEKEKRESVTADLLLQMILEDPPQRILKVLRRKEKPGTEAGTDSREKSGIGTGTESRGENAGSSVESGKKDNFLYDLTRKVKEMQTALSATVFGQDNAVSTFVSGYFQSQIVLHADRERVKPGAVFLFAGAPGVGKTYLAEQAANILGLPFLRVDMSDYSTADSLMDFAGSDGVYRGAREGAVTSFVDKNPRCVLLFDEIEKAHIKIIHLFLQLLDAGRLRDNYTDKEVFFRNTVIILTTNAGRQLYEGSRAKNLSGISRKTIIKALRTDINENTGSPLFPAALCSRFASGNVVLFNHMEAHNLRKIIHSRIHKNAQDFEKRFGLKIEVDEDVCSAVLFSEGGNADARTITGRAENFLNAELFELFRLLSSDSCGYDMEKIERIRFTVDVPEKNQEIRELFRMEEVQEILLFADKTLAPEEEVRDGRRVFFADSGEDAEQILRKEDISVVFIEPVYLDGGNKKKYLNVEDIPSKYMDFYWYIRERFPELPVYILETERSVLSEEEKVSFTRTGARGVCKVGDSGLHEVFEEVCVALHQQKAMDELAKYSRIIEFNSAQRVSDDGKYAEISLSGLRMRYAVDAGDSRKLLADVSKPDVSFDQVIGADDVKEELRFFADYLKHPRQYIRKGLRSPKGILLYGPPGTGKTMLAKALATEANMTFLTAEGGQFLKKYVGEGPEAVHDLFRTARKYAPAILFIDEIDAIGRERMSEGSVNSSAEILNALLTEMDGFRNETSELVFVLAATNFNVEGRGARTLDAALVRRFDRKLLVELPNQEQRRQFLERKVRDNPVMKISPDKLSNLAARSTGMSLAYLDSVVELSLRNAMRMRSDVVTDNILEEAFETFNSGREKKWDPDELMRTARHEAGHALVCWEGGELPAYLTIVARGDHGGYMQHENTENKGTYTKRELLARIRTALAGRAAEIVYYGNEDGLTTGASGDLEAATNLAWNMISSYGMDREAGLSIMEKHAGELEPDSPLRSRINEILMAELEKAVEIISENRKVLDRLAEVLIQENHIDGNQMKQIFAECKTTV